MKFLHIFDTNLASCHCIILTSFELKVCLCCSIFKMDDSGHLQIWRNLWPFLEGLLRLWQNFEPNLAYFYAIGQIFIVVNSQTLKNDLAIWSLHWPTTGKWLLEKVFERSNEMQRHLPRNESTLKLVQENKIFEGTVEFNYKEIQKINTKANHTR